MRKIFLYQSSFLIVKGLIWGNVIGVGLCLIQKYFGVFELDQTSYYLAKVPVNLSVLHIALLNLGATAVILLMLIVPSMIISRISPVRAIRFE